MNSHYIGDYRKLETRLRELISRFTMYMVCSFTGGKIVLSCIGKKSKTLVIKNEISLLGKQDKDLFNVDKVSIGWMLMKL